MTHRPSYLSIWIWLLALMAISVSGAFLPIPRSVIVVLLFGVATVKALLVVRHYMHLKAESWLLYAIAVVPVAFVIGFIITLLPDFVFRR